MRTNAENIVKILQTNRPCGVNLWSKFEILTVLGTVFPHFCHVYPPCQIHVYRGNVSPLRGEKPTVGLLSKNNIDIAALRAGLPVMISTITLPNAKLKYINALLSNIKATFHYSSKLQTWLQTWFSTRFAARFSTSSCGFATCFRHVFDFFCRKPDREPAASISTCRD